MSDRTWDTRYAADGYLFGKSPADFLSHHSQYLKPGSALAVADGEGRNSVFMAQRRLAVTAFDGSPVAVDKAQALAQEAGVKVIYRTEKIEEWDWSGGTYDNVVAIFIQFASPALRKAIFAGLRLALSPGGILMLHGYRPEQLAYGTGGPRQVDNLYTEDMLLGAFGDMEILRLESYDAEVSEGHGHVGMSALIDLIVRKPIT
jgi:SAM-dependent methyltransferase